MTLTQKDIQSLVYQLLTRQHPVYLPLMTKAKYEHFIKTLTAVYNASLHIPMEEDERDICDWHWQAQQYILNDIKATLRTIPLKCIRKVRRIPK